MLSLSSAGRLAALSFLWVLPLQASSVEPETWKDEKPGEGVDALRHWSALDKGENADIVQDRDGRYLLLKDGAKIQSLKVAPYPEVLELEADFSVEGAEAAGGFGFIDFSTSTYYYAFLDNGKAQWMLQRGDRKHSEVLGEAPAAGAAGVMHKVVLRADFTTEKKVSLALVVDGKEVISKTEARPADLGTTFQIYIGVGDGAEAHFPRISRISSRY